MDGPVHPSHLLSPGAPDVNPDPQVPDGVVRRFRVYRLHTANRAYLASQCLTTPASRAHKFRLFAVKFKAMGPKEGPDPLVHLEHSFRARGEGDGIVGVPT